jgi:hypothetical protein
MYILWQKPENPEALEASLRTLWRTGAQVMVKFADGQIVGVIQEMVMFAIYDEGPRWQVLAYKRVADEQPIARRKFEHRDIKQVGWSDQLGLPVVCVNTTFQDYEGSTEQDA